MTHMICPISNGPLVMELIKFEILRYSYLGLFDGLRSRRSKGRQMIFLKK